MNYLCFWTWCVMLHSRSRMEPVAQQLQLPAGYGTPTETLRWSDVRQRLEEAEQYWLATTRPDGRPRL
jgi:hypothetical protein